MSIETKTRLVVLWTIVSVIALLFITGCDDGDECIGAYWGNYAWCTIVIN